ncbi:rhomboid family intramembrane serine protease [Saccharospirillum alexandrii]|uniref:rhomboid family intramembrane serine protease n=1 Tax=Saccharospirillum alexandrii TaxID=2448477 RepID=UPI000FD795EF|nr:rhomboid family intramembrane serine protease [Saccharospirillum alexandrii]
MNLLTPTKGYWLTPAIIYINTALFALVALYTQSILWFPARELVVLGGNFGPLTVDGQWWRLLTSVFLHGGLLHLIFNAVVLANIGIFLEPLLGRVSFAIVYLITGVLASLTSLMFNYGVVSVGASGAIFGMYGFFLALLTTKLFKPEFRTTFLKNTLGFIALNIAIGFFGPIDNAAHMGGLVSGFILGYVWLPFVRKRILKTARV